MHTTRLTACALCFCLIFGLHTISAQEAAVNQAQGDKTKKSKEQELLKSFVGTWEGTVRTWFRPGELADESTIKGEFKQILGGRFLRHTYEGSMKGQTRTGEETIAYNPMKRKFQVSWFDDFHMNSGILFSEGDPIDKGFAVKGEYAAGPGQPPWS